MEMNLHFHIVHSKTIEEQMIMVIIIIIGARNTTTRMSVCMNVWL